MVKELLRYVVACCTGSVGEALIAGRERAKKTKPRTTPAVLPAERRVHSQTLCEPRAQSWQVNVLIVPTKLVWILPAELKLTEVFEQHLVPRWGHLMTDRLLAGHRLSLVWWKDLTGNPPLSAIDQATAAGFICALPRHKLSVASIQWHRRHVQHVIDFAVGVPLFRVSEYPSSLMRISLS